MLGRKLEEQSLKMVDAVIAQAADGKVEEVAVLMGVNVLTILISMVLPALINEKKGGLSTEIEMDDILEGANKSKDPTVKQALELITKHGNKVTKLAIIPFINAVVQEGILGKYLIIKDRELMDPVRFHSLITLAGTTDLKLFETNYMKLIMQAHEFTRE